MRNEQKTEILLGNGYVDLTNGSFFMLELQALFRDELNGLKQMEALISDPRNQGTYLIQSIYMILQKLISVCQQLNHSSERAHGPVQHP